MKLARPTDVEILEALSDGKRNTAANLAYHLEKDRSYINTRLPVLADYDLLDRVGPAPNSGLYEITEKGNLVLEHVDRMDEADLDFDAFIDDQLDG
ncbi:Transcriptional regulator, MarR family [Halanaeroarchaeum sp. HSR-CO]|uniref:winged helix-turn-helix domain-containing protein n=1 Tax=Halanaeroarchaeum sp. HSR-CO TaxID=2866382 RepID=UPI00217DFCD2|nr:winged helix-turn-helix domain-containing protein [Halanaeroarchaeum sp. HSR-CO]UWG46953.1 Transcriptional regulator, MarR family [Halanaeroarchaeum sp. HSR-CO]